MATLADRRVLADYAVAPRTVDLRVKLNIRDDASRNAALLRKVTPLETPALIVDRLVEGEAYLGQSQWYREANTGAFFWGGGVEMRVSPPPLPPSAIDVPMRDGRIVPLPIPDVASLYSDFAFEELPGGFVRITTPGWEANNLQPFTHRVLADIPCPNLRVHRMAVASFAAVFDAIEQANLRHLILECAGTFVARHKGSDPKRELSPHSWGIAIDLNTRANPYKAEPALPGSIGSVHELVPFFAAQGFAWGGHFTMPYRDGMHFELARRSF